jgi:hypothetical protein
MNVRRIILEAFLEARQVSFQFDQVNDCIGFAAECTRRITGSDPITILRGTYDSEISARRVMVANGWSNMGDVAAAIFPEIPMAQARSGDWAYVTFPPGSDVIGVVIGDRIACKTQTGTGQALISHATRVFRAT